MTSWIRRNAVLVALFVGLGVLSGAGGAVLGAVAASSSSVHFGGGHHDGPRHGPR